MLKNVKYIIMFVLCFFFINSEVKAMVYPQGDCYYKFEGELYGEKGQLTLRLHQDAKAKPKFFVQISGVQEEEFNNMCNQWFGDDWWDAVFGNYRWCLEDKEESKSFFEHENEYFTSCPRYAIFDQSSTKDFRFTSIEPFRNGSSVDDYASLDTSKSELKYTIQNDYEGEKCPSSDNIDWFEQPVNASSDNGFCLYYKDVTDKGCYIVQLHYNSEKVEAISNISTWINKPFENDTFFYEEGLKEYLLENGCPLYLGMGPTIGHTQNDVPGEIWEQPHYFGIFKPEYDKLNGEYTAHLGTDSYNRAVYSVFDLLPIKRLKSDPVNNSTILPKDKSIVGYDCKELIGDKMIDLLKNVVKILRILIPIILNVFGIIDFAKAIFAGNEDDMKKAQKKFIKRLIIGIVIYLIPSLLNLVLNVANKIWPVIDNTCIKDILD